MPVDRPCAGSLFCRMSTEYRYLAKQTRGSQEHCVLKGPVIPALGCHLAGLCSPASARCYMVCVKVRVITSCCCSLVSELKRTA